MGYSVELFVNREVDEEFICAICQGVLEEPVMLQTCEHLFCKYCIERWIKTNPTCPTDRTPISDSTLRQAPRFLCNLLDNLELKCNVEKCNIIVKLGNLKSHLANCPWIAKECQYGCGIHLNQEQISSHNCSKYLYDQLQLKIQENETLRATNQNQSKEIQWMMTTIQKTNEEILRLKDHIAHLEHKKKIELRYYTGEYHTETQVMFYFPKLARILVKDILANVSRSLTSEDDQQLKQVRMVEVVSHRIASIVDDEMNADVLQNADVNRYYRAEEIVIDDLASGQDELIVQIAHFRNDTRSTFGVPCFFKVRYGETWLSVKQRVKTRLGMNENDWAKVKIALVQQGFAHFIETEEDSGVVRPEHFTSFSQGFHLLPWIGIKHE